MNYSNDAPRIPPVALAANLPPEHSAVCSDFVKRLVWEALENQLPTWLEPARCLVIAVDAQHTERVDVDGNPYPIFEALITVHIFGAVSGPNRFPVFATLEHWSDSCSNGAVLRDVFARGAHGMIRVPLDSDMDSVLATTRQDHWDAVAQAWDELQASVRTATRSVERSESLGR